MVTKLPKYKLHEKHHWALGHFTSNGFGAASTWVCWCGAIKRTKHPSVLRR